MSFDTKEIFFHNGLSFRLSNSRQCRASSLSWSRRTSHLFCHMSEDGMELRRQCPSLCGRWVRLMGSPSTMERGPLEVILPRDLLRFKMPSSKCLFVPFFGPQCKTKSSLCSKFRVDLRPSSIFFLDLSSHFSAKNIPVNTDWFLPGAKSFARLSWCSSNQAGTAFNRS